MWAVIVLLCVLIFSVVALFIAYLDLHSTIKIMQTTIDFQNERYKKCLKEWDESIQLVSKVVKLNDTMTKMNRELCDTIDDELDDIHNKVDSINTDLNARLDSMSETLLKLMEPSENKEE